MSYIGQVQLCEGDRFYTEVKRDLTREERLRESFLLKERFCLINTDGVSKQHIRSKGHKLFVNSRLHGEFHSDGFVASPSLADVAPSLVNLSTKVPAISLSHSSSSNGLPSIYNPCVSNTHSISPSDTPANSSHQGLDLGNPTPDNGILSDN